MKKIFKQLLIVLIVLFSLTLLVGCNSQEKQIESLKVQAESYYNEGRYDDSIDLYSKILQIKEDKQYRDRLDEIKTDKESIGKIQAFTSKLNEIETTKTRFDIDLSNTDLQQVKRDIIKVMKDFDAISTKGNLKVLAYLQSVRKSEAYLELKMAISDGNDDFINISAKSSDMLGEKGANYQKHKDEIDKSIRDILKINI